DDDAAVPSISIDNVTVTESSNAVSAVLAVRLSATSSQVVTVRYQTADGTAVAGSDYTATNAILSFPSGTTTQTVTVRIVGDLVIEPTETFLVNLSAPTNAVLGDAQATVTILDDDVPSVFIDDVTVTEGNNGVNAVVPVRLSAASSQVVTVRYQTADGTAVAGSDYTATNGLLSFPSGSTTQAITVRVIGDLLEEATENLFVNLFASTNAVISDAQA